MGQLVLHQLLDRLVVLHAHLVPLLHLIALRNDVCTVALQELHQLYELF